MKSKVIFQNQHYTACAMRDKSLIVTRKTGGGIRIEPGPVADEWRAAIEESISPFEAAALCRGVLGR